MGLLGLLSLLHSAFFGDQVGHWGLCRGGRGSALGWGVLTMGTMVQAAGGAQTLSRKLEGFGGVSRCRRGDRCQGNFLRLLAGLGAPHRRHSDPLPPVCASAASRCPALGPDLLRPYGV